MAFVPSSLPASGGHNNLVILQMGLFDRFQRVAKAGLNDILKNLEDPEKIMNQALEDMQVCCEGGRRPVFSRLSYFPE